MPKLRLILFFLAGPLLISPPLYAQGETPSVPSTALRSESLFSRDTASTLSSEGTLLYLGLGTALPLIEDGGKTGRSRAVRTAVAVVAAEALTQGLKSIVREERPDGSDRKSFPSGHASTAFALATMRAQFHPEQAPYWYAGATLISASRVRLDRHHVHDVVAGALLGHFTARYVLKQWGDPKPSGSSVTLRGGNLTWRMEF